MSSEPADKIIENEIKATLASVNQQNRPNKLRKMVCKKITGTNWTQYQRVLDAMIHKRSLQTIKVEGEQVIQPLRDESVAISSSVPNTEKSHVRTLEMKVPFTIIKYISRKGSKKRKNIELNTKTKITFDADTTKALRSNLSSVETSILTITKTWECDDQDEDEKEAKKRAKALMKTAKLHISKMVKSNKENPDRFAAKKAGGTFAEQAETKKRKLDAVKNAKKKYQKRDNDENYATSKAEKKKQRKFY